MNYKNLRHFPIIIIFITVLLLPFLDNIFGIAPQIHFGEKRQPASLPNYSDTELKDYPRDFENYYQDNFGFRSHFIILNNKIMDKIFNVSSSKKVIKGTEGWLFYDEDFAMADCRGVMHFSQDELSALKKGLVRNWKELEKMGVTYLFLIIPDKYSIYPEYLPDSIAHNCVNGNRRIDQILYSLKKDYPNFPVLDLRPTLLQAKLWNRVYHLTDTHWNSQGAYAGYYEIIEYLSKKYPRLNPKGRREFNELEGTMSNGDLAEMMGLQIVEAIYYMQPKQISYKSIRSDIGKNYVEKKGLEHIQYYRNKNDQLPNLLMLHDSFIVFLGEFLPEHFGQTIYIRSKDLKNVNQYTCHIDLDLVKESKANIVIQQSVARKLYLTVNECKKIYEK